MSATAPVGDAPGDVQAPAPVSILDRYKPAWVLVAMAIGAGLGHVPGARAALARPHIGATNLPVAISLAVAMVALFSAVRYEALPAIVRDRRLLASSLLLEWIIGPLLTTGLAVLFLHNHPQFMAGAILAGLARCVVGEAAALNAVLLAPLLAIGAWLFLNGVPVTLGPRATAIHIGIGALARGVGGSVGLPLVVGVVARFFVPRRLLDRAAQPLGSAAMFVAITLLFALNGQAVTGHPWEIPLVLIPLMLSWILVLPFAVWMVPRGRFALPADRCAVAIAVTVGLFGIDHGAPFAAAIGLAIESPIWAVLPVRWRRDRMTARSDRP